MAIEGKVAAILNERDLVVNKGTEAGVKEGMKFKVTEPKLQVKDPETGESLGTLDREKIRVRIVEVEPKYSIGKTYETYMVNVGGAGVGLGFLTRLHELYEPRQDVTKVRTLRIDDSISLAPMNEDESFVRVGDQVVEVEDEN